MKLKFTKMQALGNDYVYIFLRSTKNINLSYVSKLLSRRRFSVGSDGLIVLTKSLKADCKMLVFNADGSEAETCGNALRCVGYLLYEKCSRKRTSFIIETKNDLNKVTVKKNTNLVTAQINNITFNNELIDKDIKINKTIYHTKNITVCNPHSVVIVEDFKNLNVNYVGEKIENYKDFKNKTNVEFAKLINQKEIEVKVWERGSGRTLACGSGGVAVVTVFCLMGLTNFEESVIVRMEGGNLTVNISKDFKAKITSEVFKTFEGTVYL